MLLRTVLMSAVLFGIGCAAPTTRDRPFTDDWAYVRQHESDKPRFGGDIALSEGGGGLPPTRLRIDEQGKPALQFGEHSRWRPEVSISGGDPKVGVKYQRKF